MVDLHGRDKGNISLPLKLHSYKDGEDRNMPTIINTQRTFYDIRIEDIKSEINRLNERNDKLLENIETNNELMFTVDEKTADEISDLSKQVSTQNDRVEHLKNQIDTVENNRVEDKRSYERNVESFNQKYKKKKVELVSQIKVLNAKINTLEDFKKNQKSLEENFKMRRKRMIENDEKLKDILENIKQKFRFDEEMLKNELYCRLLNLAAKFQLNTNKHISLPNQRLMRENIMLQNEFLEISKEISLKKEVETNFKSSAMEQRRNIIECRSNINENIITKKVQNSVLKSLEKIFGKMKKRLSFVKIPDPGMENKCLALIESAQQEECMSNINLAKLQTLLYKERTKIGITKYLQSRIECKIKAVVETLYDLKYIVTCLLQCSASESGYVNLLLLLQNKLIRGQSKFLCSIVKSIESISREIEYSEDLKGIPENIDSEMLMESDEKEPLLNAVLKETKSEMEREDGKEICPESSASDEESLHKILKNFDIDLKESLLNTDTEFIDEEESLFDINEE
ncbi:kinetochore protein SLK19-like [Colletes gigas]|uniref:kinetochore protein SLK19-like n=1 Tax=Colletes gigas TaxID=935657 RepID=UPI001C9A7C78|nr:kinetochore protein SLK19-like [Colletes gigas]